MYSFADMNSAQYDVIIIGGSYAGLQAALTLGRSKRQVLVIDCGMPCNRFTPHSHNFLTHDGKAPHVIAAEGREQLKNYPNVKFLKDTVLEALQFNENFEITTIFEKKKIIARKLLFATGISDVMPDIKGFNDCWGKSVIHCPYCHGYEVKGQVTGVFGNGESGFEYVKTVSHWAGKVTLFTNGPSLLNNEETQKLAAKNITVIETPVTEVIHEEGQISGLVLSDGTTAGLSVLYAHTAFKQHCDIPQALGCEMADTGHIKTNGYGKTNVMGLYVAGDCCDPLRSVSSAVRGGMAAAAFLNKELINEDF